MWVVSRPVGRRAFKHTGNGRYVWLHFEPGHYRCVRGLGGRTLMYRKKCISRHFPGTDSDWLTFRGWFGLTAAWIFMRMRSWKNGHAPQESCILRWEMEEKMSCNAHPTLATLQWVSGCSSRLVLGQVGPYSQARLSILRWLLQFLRTTFSIYIHIYHKRKRISSADEDPLTIFFHG